MDECLLNDLLECSVCLERLDTSSRVLPCQHTFCLKCLKVIVESHKELRCPECRILVEVKVEELPPNVLLMRILEGMKNSAPRKPTISGHRKTGHPATQIQAVQPSRSDGKQLPPHARAMYDYISKDPGDLSFKKGDMIVLQKKLDPFWYQGECSGRTGMFPITYVQVVVPLPIPTALCKALYDFRMSAPDEEGCLAFDRGAIITVHRRVDENWAEGRLDQRVGIFPIAFVELNQPARHLINCTPLNRPVPPVPDQSRPSHSDHRHHVQHPHRYQQMAISTPAAHSNYQNVSAMAHSHPNYHASPHQPAGGPPGAHFAAGSPGVLAAAVPRAVVDPAGPKSSLDLVTHFINVHNKAGPVGLQSAPRIDNFDRRLAKFDSYNSTPVHKAEAYAGARDAPPAAAFSNPASSDSSSSATTASAAASCTTSSPDTGSTSPNSSSCGSTAPSLPGSPDVAPDAAPDAAPDPAETSTATNTSLNVSLPPADSPKAAPAEAREAAGGAEPAADGPSSSKATLRSAGPDSLLNFGIGLQAALSPGPGKDGGHAASKAAREHYLGREKRHSLTPSSHLQGGHAVQNRHSAEILATCLLDQLPERERPERERRRRRSRSNERPLPAAYVALYPYKPQKPDELELRKGAVYTVTERCRDGWYKGCGERSPRCGVFPGNYVAPAPQAHTRKPKNDKQNSVAPSVTGGTPAGAPAAVPLGAPAPAAGTLAPPDAPPRAHSPLAAAQPLMYTWGTQAQSQQSTPRSEKHTTNQPKEKSKAEKSSISTGVSLMKKLAAMKKCKSPPPVGYSMDNPVFEDGPGTSLMLNLAQHHPVHVRSGSCPSQLLRALPASERLRHKERPGVLAVHEHARRSSASEGPWQSQHRKSQSLDVTAARRDRHHSQAVVKERFRCVVPYPPNSEYELELKLDDIVIVSRKRGDGWYKGTLQRTGRTGLFPASFVQSCPQMDTPPSVSSNASAASYDTWYRGRYYSTQPVPHDNQAL